MFLRTSLSWQENCPARHVLSETIFSPLSSFSLSVGVWFLQVKNENGGFSILRGCNYLFPQHVMPGSTLPFCLLGFWLAWCRREAGRTLAGCWPYISPDTLTLDRRLKRDSAFFVLLAESFIFPRSAALWNCLIAWKGIIKVQMRRTLFLDVLTYKSHCTIKHPVTFWTQNNFSSKIEPIYWNIWTHDGPHLHVNNA